MFKKESILQDKALDKELKKFVSAVESRCRRGFNVSYGRFLFQPQAIKAPMHLLQINIMQTGVKDEDILLLVHLNCPQLNFIRISSPHITLSGAKNLTLGDWPSLRTLDLQSCNIGNQGLRHLAERANWPKLLEISVYNNRIDNQGVKWLNQANWPAGQVLIINHNVISDSGALSLCAYPHFGDLKNLYLLGMPTYVSDSLQIQLSEMLPARTYFDLRRRF